MNDILRRLACLLLAVACLLPLAACRGREEIRQVREYRVAIVQYMDHASLNQIAENIESRLDEQGEALGVSFRVSFYNGLGDAETLKKIGAELTQQGTDLIIPIATPAARAMQSAAKGTDIPIVFSAVTDPVGAGLVDDLKKPGGRITGTSDAPDAERALELLFALNPWCRSVGLLYDEQEASSDAAIGQARAFLEEKGVRCVEKTGSTKEDITAAAAELVSAGVGAVFTPTDNTVMSAETEIAQRLSKSRVGHYTLADAFALNGAFIGFGADYAALGRATADLAAGILADGKDPAETPVQVFDAGILTVNTDTAKRLGYTTERIESALEDESVEVRELTTHAAFPGKES